MVTDLDLWKLKRKLGSDDFSTLVIDAFLKQYKFKNIDEMAEYVIAEGERRMRREKKEDKKVEKTEVIELTEDVRLPETGIILEKGDKIEILKEQTGKQFALEGGLVMTTKDDYEQGEVGSSTEYSLKDVGTNSLFWEKDSIIDILSEISEQVFSKDFSKEDWEPFDDEGRIDGQFLVNEDNFQPSPKEIEAWKRGEKNLFHAYVITHIKTVVGSYPTTEEEMKAEGLY